MQKYWIVATQESPKRLVELVEREPGLHGTVVAAKGTENEQTLYMVADSIVDPNWVRVVGQNLGNDNVGRIDAAWSRLRAERNARLAACDWTQLSDAQVDKVAWAAYRQALRNVPQNTQDPEGTINWPEQPE